MVEDGEFKQYRGGILTIAVCAVVPVPRLHYHSVRSLKHREGGGEVITVHANTETQHTHTQKLRYEPSSLINRNT